MPPNRLLADRLWRRLGDCVDLVQQTDDAALTRCLHKMDKPTYDVFLGGSCGSTTWRREQAMPFLDKLGITYFNPQVSSWRPDLIELEEWAKTNSQFLLFVLDPSTTNASTVIEIAYLTGCGATLLVVLLEEHEWYRQSPNGDAVDRERTADFLRCITDLHKVCIFRSLGAALHHIAQTLLARRRFADALRDSRTRQPYLKLQLDKTMHHISESISTINITSGSNACMQWLYPSSRTQAVRQSLMCVELILLCCVCCMCPDIPVLLAICALLLIHVITCCALPYTWLQEPIRWRHRLSHNRLGFVERSRRNESNTANHHRAMYYERVVKQPISYDVFVDGSGDDQWVRDTVLPLFTCVLPFVCTLFVRRAHLSYGLSDSCPLLAQKVRILSGCHFVLYYINDSEMLLSGMTKLAYLYGRGCRVIGCIDEDCSTQLLPENITAAQYTHTDSGIHNRNICYSRALAYLRDIAIRRDCVLYNTLHTAIHDVLHNAKLYAINTT